MDASICDGQRPEDTTMAISTKNNQIIYLNIFTQVYFPDHVKMFDDLKGQFQSKDAEVSSDSEQSDRSDQELMLDGSPMRSKKGRQIKIIGIEEERSVDQRLKDLQEKAIREKHNMEEFKKEIVKLENEALID